MDGQKTQQPQMRGLKIAVSISEYNLLHITVMKETVLFHLPDASVNTPIRKMYHHRRNNARTCKYSC
jgi:hypothetical protein